MRVRVNGKQLLRAVQSLKFYIYEKNEWPFIVLSSSNNGTIWASATNKAAVSAFQVEAEIEEPGTFTIGRDLEQILQNVKEGEICLSSNEATMTVEGPSRFRSRLQLAQKEIGFPIDAILERLSSIDVIGRLAVDKSEVQKILNLSYLYGPHPTLEMRWLRFSVTQEGVIAATQESSFGAGEMLLEGDLETTDYDFDCYMQTDYFKAMLAVCPSRFLLRMGRNRGDPVVLTGIGEEEDYWITGAAQINIERVK